jgi:hypothetical protein
MPECPSCKRELTTMHGVRTHHTRVHDEHLPNRTCKGCSTTFYDETSQRSFCDNCDPRAGSNNSNWRGGKCRADCRQCGAEFEYYESDKAGKFCPECVSDSDRFLGEAHVSTAKRVERECEHCADVMEVRQSRIENGGGRFCSHECLCNWMSANVVGEAHHQWRSGGATYGGSWWTVRRKALERDAHQCQHCGSKRSEMGREPDVHHLRPVREFDEPESAHYLANVVSLCRSCHRNVEVGNISPPSPGDER